MNAILKPTNKTLPTTCIACVAGATHRAAPALTQDAASIATAPDGGKSVILSDGIGGFACGGETAWYLAPEARRLLENTAYPRECPRVLFHELHTNLAGAAREREETLPEEKRVPEANRPRSYGATLLVARDMADELQLAYAGNGGIFHIRGDFVRWGEPLVLPWSATNYLNPHSILEGGREALCRYLGAFAPQGAAEPTVLSLRKDTRVGDILLLCTDGIYSSDQAQVGRAGDSLWQEVSQPLVHVLRALRNVFAADVPVDADGLQTALDFCLADLRENGLLEDDATVGVLVTQAAVAHQHSLGCNKETEETDGGAD